MIIKQFNTLLMLQGGGPSAGGACYYMCEYLRSHRRSPWVRATTFDEARRLSAICSEMEMNHYARSRNMQNANGHLEQDFANTDITQQHLDGLIPNGLQPNRVYRIDATVGVMEDNLHGGLHEINILSDFNRMLIFDPNIGFLLFYGTTLAIVQNRLFARYNRLANPHWIRLHGLFTPALPLATLGGHQQWI